MCDHRHLGINWCRFKEPLHYRELLRIPCFKFVSSAIRPMTPSNPLFSLHLLRHRTNFYWWSKLWTKSQLSVVVLAAGAPRGFGWLRIRIRPNSRKYKGLFALETVILSDFFDLQNSRYLVHGLNAVLIVNFLITLLPTLTMLAIMDLYF